MPQLEDKQFLATLDVNLITPEISKTRINKALRKAVTLGEETLIKALCSMQTDNKPTQKAIDEALLAAASKEAKWKIVSYLCSLTGDNKPSSKAVSTALVHASDAGEFEVVNSLCAIQEDNKPDAPAVAYALRKAARLGLRGSVETLCAMKTDNGPNQEAVNNALAEAQRSTHADQWNIVQHLCRLETDNKPSQKAVSKAFRKASDLGASVTVTNLCAMQSENKPNAPAIAYALHNAAHYGSMPLVEVLCAMKGDNKPSQAAVDDALSVARKNGKWDVVQYLCRLETDNKPSQRAVNKALKKAADVGEFATVIHLCAMKTDNKPNSSAVTYAQQKAQHAKKVDVVSAIVSGASGTEKKPSDIHAKEPILKQQGQAEQHQLEQHQPEQQQPEQQQLEQQQLEQHQLEQQKEQLLALLEGKQWDKVLEIIQSNTALINVPLGHSEDSPLAIAAYFGVTELVEELIKLGADVNAKNKNGYIPLSLAIIGAGKHGNNSPHYRDIVSCLILNGSDLTSANSEDGCTPVSLISQLMPLWGRLLPEPYTQETTVRAQAAQEAAAQAKAAQEAAQARSAQEAAQANPAQEAAARVVQEAIARAAQEAARVIAAQEAAAAQARAAQEAGRVKAAQEAAAAQARAAQEAARVKAAQEDAAAQARAAQEAARVKATQEAASEAQARAAQEAEVQQQFSSALIKIDVIIDGLDCRIGQDNLHFTDAAWETATRLITELKTARDDYYDAIVKSPFNIPQAHAAKHEFKRACGEAIDRAMEVLERDLGWGDYLLNCLKKLVNAFTSPFRDGPTLFTLKRATSAVEASTAGLAIEQLDNAEMSFSP